jgi:protein gp37
VTTKTSIEWTEYSWNFATGCDRVSPGCDHCYALTMAARNKAMGSARYQRDGNPKTSGPGFGVTVHRDLLWAPYSWRKPRLVFVNSMGDFWHAEISDGALMTAWRVMGETPLHRYQILTKRADRMERWMRKWSDIAGDREAASRPSGMPPMPRGPEPVRAAYESGRARLFADMLDFMGPPPEGAAYPLYDWMEGIRWWPRVLPNIWLGVSVESPPYYSRIRHLQRTPAAVRFLSCEPLLEPLPDLPLEGISWVITGGESGPGARPAKLEWFRQIRDQCQAAGVAYFHKQHGSVLARQLGLPGKGGHAAAILDGRRYLEMPG